MRRPHRYLAGAILALTALAAGPAPAQTYNPVINTSPDLGIVIPAPTTPTTFTFSASTGNVTQSGTAVRRTSGQTRAQVTINCTGGGNDCGVAMKVRVGSIGTPTGKAGALGNFTISQSVGTISGLTGTNPVEFIITPQNKNQTPVFYIGADFPIAAGNGAGTTGAASSQFYVYVDRSPTTPTTGVVGTASATTYRGVSFEGTPSLNFGSIVRPGTGSATVSIDPATGGRTITGSAGGGSPARASYVIKGEGGQAISVSQDAALTLTRSGGGTISVTLSRTALPTLLSGSAGVEGAASFYTGGSFVVTSSTPVGDYSGAFNTTVNYN